MFELLFGRGEEAWGEGRGDGERDGVRDPVLDFLDILSLRDPRVDPRRDLRSAPDMLSGELV